MSKILLKFKRLKIIMTRYEVRIAGYGGQGVITLSKMIITAASMYEGLAGTQTEAYSAAARELL